MAAVTFDPMGPPMPPWMQPDPNQGQPMGDLQSLYGPQAPLQFPQMEQMPQFDPSQLHPMERMALALHGAIGGMPPVNPYATQGDQFGQSLLRGAVGGFIQPSLNRIQGQQQQLTAQQEAVKERNKANIQATLAARNSANTTAGGILRDSLKPKSPPLTLKDRFNNAKASAEGTAAGGGDAAPDLSDEGLNIAADMYAQTGQLPAMGMGKKGAVVRTAIINRAAARHPGTNLASNVAGFGADKASLSKLTTGTDQVISAENTALANSKVLEGTIKNIPDTGNQIGNALFRPFLEKAGSPDVTNFHNALGTVQTEFARILNSGMAGNAPLTDAARKDLQGAIGNSFTKKQLLGALSIYKQDAHNRRTALEAQIGEVKKRIGRPPSANVSPAGGSHLQWTKDAQGNPVGRMVPD